MAVETDTAEPEPVPDTIDVAGAVALMSGTDPGDAGEPGSPARDDVDDRLEPEAAEGGGEVQAEAEVPTVDEAPEFWGPDDKVLWQDVPEGLRPVLRKYEQQRIAFANEKAREAARAREEAGRVVDVAANVFEHTMAWWQQNGPTMQQAFGDKWAAVDWDKLAGENPAEWAKLKQQRDKEADLLRQAAEQAQRGAAVQNQRIRAALLEAQHSEHVKLAARLPDYFGPDKAATTYKELGDFLFSVGIPAERINAIYEAPVIELALDALRFRKAQKQASTVTKPGAANTTAKMTPTRVQPGPAARAAGNRNAELARQVDERFRRSGGADINDAAELIRLNGL